MVAVVLSPCASKLPLMMTHLVLVVGIVVHEAPGTHLELSGYLSDLRLCDGDPAGLSVKRAEGMLGGPREEAGLKRMLLRALLLPGAPDRISADCWNQVPRQVPHDGALLVGSTQRQF
jgi:hypothetical protein